MPLIDRICKYCKKPFETEERYVKRGEGNFCSRSCSSKSKPVVKRFGDENPNWKGGVSKDSYRYKMRQLKKHPNRVKAREEVQKALRSGKLTKKPCELCGDPKVQAHHVNYARPLKVVWLCRSCHDKTHAKKAT